MIYIAAAIFGYLLGSINTSIIYSKFKRQDIRNYGSGNAGATNTLRTYGKKAAALVLLGDVLKGVIVVLVVKLSGNSLCVYIAGFAAILGHNFPLYFGFKGGKGILTSLAVMTAIAPISGAIALAVGLITIIITKYVSLGSIIGSLAFGVSVFLSSDDTYLRIFTFVVVLLAIIRHHQNIGRLIQGTERKLGKND